MADATTDVRYVLPLAGVGLADTHRVGRKAAFLGELMRAGFPVPPGFVVTTEALGEVLGSTAAGPAGVDPTIADLPGPVRQALAQVAAAVGDTAVAVRSSGVSEDLAGSSFAGQYESVLDVRGESALVAAVRQCWASAFSQRVLEYQRGRGHDGAPAMAVVVQQMVPADAAGVAFSANPVTGRRDEVVLSVVRGLAERLVSGNASPDEWVVRDGVAKQLTRVEDAITQAQALETARLVRKVEAAFGEPQDVEWAIADGQVWLLQARPITALPDEADAGEPIPVEVPEGSWKRDPFTRTPWSPLQVSLLEPVLEETSRALGAFGLAEGMQYRQIGGWTYSRIVPVEGDAAVAERVGRIVAAVAQDEPWLVINRWYDEWRPSFVSEVARLRQPRLAELDDEGLVAHLAEVRRLLADVYRVHFTVTSAGLFLMGELGLASRDLLGWDIAQMLGLVTGLQSMTTEPSFRLAEIAQRARALGASRRLLEVLARPDGEVLDGLREVSAELAEDFAGYLDAYGQRSAGIDLTDPTLAEQPKVLFSLLVDMVAGEYDPAAEAQRSRLARETVLAEARTLLADQTDAERERFERALVRASYAQPTRDDKAFVIALVRALLRDAAVELGRRLAARGVVERADDVFFLTDQETVRALSAGVPVDLEAPQLVAQRRAADRWARANRGPLHYGEHRPVDPALLDAWLAAMPEAIRPVMAVIFWVFASVSNESAVGTATEGGLSGIAASPGRYTGPVRVIRDEREFDKLRPGDVLVCPETTPQWSIVFPKVGALVTDTGGLLSHPAIIAREYRVPAVLATATGTETLRDGQIVTVDGGAGTVEPTA